MNKADFTGIGAGGMMLGGAMDLTKPLEFKPLEFKADQPFDLGPQGRCTTVVFFCGPPVS